MTRTLKTWHARYDHTTTGLMALLAGLWLATAIHGLVATGSWRVILAPPVQLLTRWGAPSEPVLWQATAGCFLHAGLLHLLLNLSCLKVVAPPLERESGKVLPFALFVVGGTLAMLLSRELAGLLGDGWLGRTLTGGPIPVVGASAGILAIAGGLVVSCAAEGSPEMATPIVGWMGRLLGLGLLVNLVGWVKVDNAGHLFGFLVGAALIRLLLMLRRAAGPALLALGLASLALVGWAIWHLV